MENHIEMDDLEVPPFQETSIWVLLRNWATLWTVTEQRILRAIQHGSLIEERKKSQTPLIHSQTKKYHSDQSHSKLLPAFFSMVKSPCLMAESHFHGEQKPLAIPDDRDMDLARSNWDPTPKLP